MSRGMHDEIEFIIRSIALVGSWNAIFEYKNYTHLFKPKYQ